MLNHNLGTLKGKGSSTRRFGFCRTNNADPSICFNEILGTTPLRTPPLRTIASTSIPKPEKMRAVFLLELPADNSVLFTANYYWDTYPEEFTRCPVINTGATLNKTLASLDEYYGYGFRYFIGFARSSILKDILPWFNSHPDAIGMSNGSTDPTLNIPKPIFRMNPSDDYLLKSIQPYLEGKTINYIYSPSENAPRNLIPYIESIPRINLNLVPINSANDFTTIEFQNTVNNFLNTDVILFYQVADRDLYISLFSENGPITFSGQQYDLLSGVPPIIKTNFLANKYNFISYKGINTSILWRNGYYFLGASKYSTVTLNILNMLNHFANNQSIDNINTHYGSLIFNPVTKDIDFYSFLIEKFNGTNFINTNLSVKDPYLGEFNANFVSNTPVSTDIIPILSKKPFYGKAIGLFDLGYVNQTDYISYQSLYHFWLKDSSLPKFPTVDITDQTPSQVADILTSYYKQGYKLFLGPNYAFTLATAEILNWFSSHPDAICICLYSGATITNIPSNIYRLAPQASEIITLLIKKIIASVKVYCIYDAADPLGVDVNRILSSFCTNTEKPYNSFPIDNTATNLTVSNMLNFFGVVPSNIPATTSDINIIVSNSNLQNYLNLYYDVSMNHIVCPQYIGTGQVDPTIPIPTGGTVLNKNLYTIDITYTSSSYLWNENRLFLTNEYSSNTDSRQLLNALKMMQYILAGKDIRLLGFHLGTLQFSSINNIMFPSVLIQQYQATPNKFVNYEIDFTDPLLGVFKATFV